MINQEALRKLIEESGIRFKHNGRSWVFTCPRCSKKDKLYIRKTDGRFVCFYCRTRDNFEGRADYALSELLGVPREDLQAKLFGYARATIRLEVDLDFQNPSEENPNQIIIPEAKVMPMPLDFFPLDHKHGLRGLAYLEGRGVPLDVAQEYEVRYHPASRRVVFPVIMDGKCRGWQLRTIVGAEPKVLSSTDLPRDHTLMFYDRLGFEDHAVMAEGPISAIKAHHCGGNVATMGKVVTALQIELLKQKGIHKIYLGLDRDAAQETAKLVRDMAPDFETYHLLPPAHRDDLGDCTYDEVFDAFLTAPRVNAARIFIHF